MAVCKECGILFSPAERTQSDLCTECVNLENEDFDMVKAYIQAHPNTNLLEIVRDTEVPLRTVDKFIQSGRLHRGR